MSSQQDGETGAGVGWGGHLSRVAFIGHADLCLSARFNISILTPERCPLSKRETRPRTESSGETVKFNMPRGICQDFRLLPGYFCISAGFLQHQLKIRMQKHKKSPQDFKEDFNTTKLQLLQIENTFDPVIQKIELKTDKI